MVVWTGHNQVRMLLSVFSNQVQEKENRRIKWLPVRFEVCNFWAKRQTHEVVITLKKWNSNQLSTNEGAVLLMVAGER